MARLSSIELTVYLWKKDKTWMSVRVPLHSDVVTRDIITQNLTSEQLADVNKYAWRSLSQSPERGIGLVYLEATDQWRISNYSPVVDLHIFPQEEDAEYKLEKGRQITEANSPTFGISWAPDYCYAQVRVSSSSQHQPARQRVQEGGRVVPPHLRPGPNFPSHLQHDWEFFMRESRNQRKDNVDLRTVKKWKQAKPAKRDAAGATQGVGVHLQADLPQALRQARGVGVHPAAAAPDGAARP